MFFSYRKLEKYFAEPLSSVETVAEKLISHAFEVESVAAKGDDWELDIKILPDRATDANMPLGMARELSAVLNQPLKENWQAPATADSARAQIAFSIERINQLTGVSLSEEAIVGLLRRSRITTIKKDEELIALAPPERVDVNIIEDLADEVARLYGYDKIPAQHLPPTDQEPVNHPDFVLSNQLREFFTNHGFTEHYGYTFTPRGAVAVAKPLASDKTFLRTDLLSSLTKTIEFNLRHIIFDTDAVEMFEIGAVFPVAGQEEISLGFGIGRQPAKAGRLDEEIDAIITELSREFNTDSQNIKIHKKDNLATIQIPLKALTAKPKAADLNPFIKEVEYQPFSVYPRITRDIALLAPKGTVPESVADKIKSSAGGLLVLGPALFDEFPKDGKVSLAFRLVFQASDRTLSDGEVNKIMADISAALTASDWIVR